MIKVKAIEYKIARIRAGYRQYEVAAKLGIHPSQLSEIESGRRKPSTELLQRLLEVLNQAKSGEVESED